MSAQNHPLLYVIDEKRNVFGIILIVSFNSHNTGIAMLECKKIGGPQLGTWLPQPNLKNETHNMHPL